MKQQFPIDNQFNFDEQELIPFQPISPISQKTKNSQIQPQVQNVVISFDTQCKIDLTQIALQIRNAQYNPKKFSAVIVRLIEPKSTALIFSTGKIICTGNRSENAAKISSKKFCLLLKKLGFPVQSQNYQIQNFVCSCDVKFPIDLEFIAQQHLDFCSYEPEVFPGLIYRMMDP